MYCRRGNSFSLVIASNYLEVSLSGDADAARE